MAKLEFRTEISHTQNMLISQFCIPVWNEFKKLMRVQIGPEVNQLQASFTTPALPYIDPMKEANATVTAIRNGLPVGQKQSESRGLTQKSYLVRSSETLRR